MIISINDSFNSKIVSTSKGQRIRSHYYFYHFLLYYTCVRKNMEYYIDKGCRNNTYISEVIITWKTITNYLSLTDHNKKLLAVQFNLLSASPNKKPSEMLTFAPIESALLMVVEKVHMADSFTVEEQFNEDKLVKTSESAKKIK